MMIVICDYTVKGHNLTFFALSPSPFIVVLGLSKATLTPNPAPGGGELFSARFGERPLAKPRR